MLGDGNRVRRHVDQILSQKVESLEDDAILSTAQVSRPVSAQSGDVASTVVDCDLVEVCKRAAAKLGITWPITLGNPGEMKQSWDKPFSHCVTRVSM